MSLAGILTAMILLSPGGECIELARAIEAECRPALRQMATVIAFKESSFRNVGCNDTNDCGVFQINEVHGHSEKALKNVTYSTRVACGILADKYDRYAHKDKMWAARFHSSTPSVKKGYYLQLWDLIAKGSYEN